MTKPRKGGAAGRLAALLDAGDHAEARAEAERILASAGATEAERKAAAELVASLRPEPAAVVVGLAGVATAAAIVAWLLAR
ncbi:MAG TPA: hypothetical protein VFP50_11675 [Anaeromyxobacteraceae bacterium]|nr:hypothetical protein [Anaeromyxobacteraceae bacterium]